MKHVNPSQLLLLFFGVVILIGTALLMLPISINTGMKPIAFIDALFTSTSAVCVTGLIVHDTPRYFSTFGQMIILSLIQIGGLGIMTFSIFVGFFSGGRISLSHQKTLNELLDTSRPGNMIGLIKKILQITLIVEFFGFAFLALILKDKVDSPLYHAFFHTVSAFCNAGFSTFSDSLMQFRADILLNIVISALIIIGGVGFVVILNILYSLPEFLKKSTYPLFKLQTKIVLVGTVSLIIAGTLLFYLLEQNNPAFEQLSFSEQVISSFFQSVTARTAGFNTVDIGSCSKSALLLIMFLMFVGASPGGTGGGIKITTFVVTISLLVANLKSEPQIRLFRRTISNDAIRKAFCIVNLFIMITFTIILILSHTENLPILDIAFETISAIATVGLSTGITASLSPFGKSLIILAMFFGRLGPLSIVLALGKNRQDAFYTYPEEKIMIG